jgi:hypothetical protein
VAEAVLHRIVLDGADPRLEFGVTAALLAEARPDPAAPPTLVITRLTGAARALGRFQPAPAAPGSWVRRHTGGVACAYGAGMVSVVLVLPDLMAFGGVPFLDKVINRAVRGTVRGLASLGLAAAYGGRDFIAAAGRRVGLVAMAAEAGGPCLFQAVLGLDAPARAGKDVNGAWAALKELVPDLDFGPLAEALTRGHLKATGRTVLDRPAPAPQDVPPAAPEPNLAWGPAVAVPIGHLAAGLRLDRAGGVEARGLAGDFMADGGLVPALARALAGRVPDRGAVTRAVEELLADPARHVVPGVPDPNAIVNAVLAAAEGERSHVVHV